MGMCACIRGETKTSDLTFTTTTNFESPVVKRRSLNVPTSTTDEPRSKGSSFSDNDKLVPEPEKTVPELDKLAHDTVDKVMLDKVNDYLRKFSYSKKKTAPVQRSSVDFKENEPTTVINIAVCGDSQVGKSSLMLRYTNNQFDKFYIVSIAPEKGTKNFKFKEYRYTLNFIVFPGDPAYIEDYSSEYAKADCILFVFDFLEKESFNLIIRERNQLIERGNKSVHYFIGNKVESKSKQLYGPDCRKYCEDNKIGYFEVSVKENLNIEKTFQKICENFSSAKTSA